MTSHRRTRSERLAVRCYARLGSRVWWVGLAIAVSLGVIAMGVTLFIGEDYVGMSSSDALSLLALWGPIAVLMVPVALFPVRRQAATILSWSAAEDKAAVAVSTWSATVRNRRLVIRAAAFVGLVVPLAAVDIVLRFHKPWWSAALFTLAFLVALASVAAAVVAISDLILRPMLEDIADYLRPGVAPHPLGRRLQLRALIPLPLVTGFATIVVAAYAHRGANSVVRLSIALGVTCVTVGVATLIFSLVNRSLLSPIDDLSAATARVRAGDLDVSVPVVTDDELGALALEFNQMIEDLRLRTESLRASRQRIVTASTLARRQVERDLHDGAQQQFVLAQLKLGLAERAIESDPARAKAILHELHDDMARALAELRDLARGIYPQLLETDGLAGALREAVRRAPIHAELTCEEAERYEPEVEAAIYFCCVEAMQNAAKHAGPNVRATVQVGATLGALLFEVSDDGPGFDVTSVNGAGGLRNMEDRLGALGGELQISSRPGAGTRVRGAVPVRTGGQERR